jgi:hypothetical protein
VRIIVIAQVPVLVHAKTLDVAVPQQRAREIVPTGDGNDIIETDDGLDIRQQTALAVAIRESALAPGGSVGSHTPALQLSRSEHGAGMMLAKTERGGGLAELNERCVMRKPDENGLVAP